MNYKYGSQLYFSIKKKLDSIMTDIFWFLAIITLKLEIAALQICKNDAKSIQKCNFSDWI